MLKTWLSSPLRAMDRCSKRGRIKRLSSGFDLLASPFSDMKVSDQLKQVFKAIDVDGDGKISSAELKEVLLSLSYKKSMRVAAREAEVMVRVLDCNGDGVIDLDEFIDAVYNMNDLKSGDEEHHLMDAFSIFDTNKDGLISAMELQRVLHNLGFENCSLKECRRMIQGVDKDGDGFVDFKEFKFMMTVSAFEG
ncbi:calcium-binding protein CML23 [Tripterygium wilfordii]|uniref:Calcium-binding protein CML23 n=1 Tax=Tripterygium wilfordii TaxID=458696 RepID=A0A7J7CG17_TRIWF|nr:probable calcium-binding protein CML23 [Tripterygium wilfordii]KAF5732965.1 calcium-binding protein CML23 [Tripterygium wilfordii]